AYALRHWQALTCYLSDGFLDIDNNLAELTLRHIAIGRKNWLFAGNAKGAETAAILFSVTSTCHRHGIDAFAYILDLLHLLRLHPATHCAPGHPPASRRRTALSPPRLAARSLATADTRARWLLTRSPRPLGSFSSQYHPFLSRSHRPPCAPADAAERLRSSPN